jgi:uncharacterized protein (DUF2267 family)
VRKVHESQFVGEVRLIAALPDEAEAERAVVAVFATLQELLGSATGMEGEAWDVMSQLPKDLKRLWFGAHQRWPSFGVFDPRRLTQGETFRAAKRELRRESHYDARKRGSYSCRGAGVGAGETCRPPSVSRCQRRALLPDRAAHYRPRRERQAR